MRQIKAAAVVAVALAFSACATTPQDAYPATITTLDAYELQDDPSSAIQYPGNANIFAGEVIGSGSPRKVSRSTETGDRFSYIFTPITVKVAQVFRGDQATIGSTVVIRALGGRIGREMTVSGSSPKPEDYRKGMKIYFFTPEFLDAGDGLVAATPNFSYAEDAIGNVYSMRDPEQKAPAAGFSMRISEYIDWTHPRTGG